MKTRLLIFTAAATVLVGAASGCKTEYVLPDIGTATVTIQKSLSTDSSSATVTFIPSEDAVSFRYAIGTDMDFEDFRDGSLPASETADGNSPVEKTFEGLNPESAYTVYAVACDSRGFEGEISTAKIITDDASIKFTESYLLSTSAGFTLAMSSNYRGFTYFLGKEDDRDAFLAGETDNSTINDIDEYTVNYFGLESDSDYVFFSMIADRAGNTAKIIEHPFHTPASGSCPDVELEYENDFYTGNYTLTPVAGCSRIASIITAKGENDAIIYSTNNWKGDISAMLQSWQNVEGLGVYVSENGKAVEMTYTTPGLVPDNPIEIYVLLYGEDGQPCGVKHYDLSTPAFDDDAPEATVSIEISAITSSGATYTYTMGDGTTGLLYDTIDADWFDEFSQTSEYHEHYLHELLFQNGKWWAYMGPVVTYTETEGEPGKRYYAAGCPMNCNGILGWGDLVLEEYTTSEN